MTLSTGINKGVGLSTVINPNYEPGDSGPPGNGDIDHTGHNHVLGDIQVTGVLTVADISNVVGNGVGYANPAFWGGTSNLVPNTYPPGGYAYLMFWRTDGHIQVSIVGAFPNSGWNSLTIGDLTLWREDATYYDTTPGETGYVWEGFMVNPFPAPGQTVQIEWRD